MGLSNPEEAKQYIKETMHVNPDSDEGRAATRKIVINHKEIANTFVKYINAIPDMPKECKMVMTLKIVNPGMTNMQVALGMGLMLGEVDELEIIGKRIVEKYLEVMPLQEGIDRFNRSEFMRRNVEALRLPPSNNPTVVPNNANPDDIAGLA